MKSLKRLTSVATLMVVMMLLGSTGFSSTTVASVAARTHLAQHAHAHAQSRSGAAAALKANTAKNGTFVSYNEPDEALISSSIRQSLGALATDASVEAATQTYLNAWNARNYHGPNPQAYSRLQHNEQRALAANSSPAALGLAVTGTLRLFAVAVEFNGADTAENFSYPTSVYAPPGGLPTDRTCITSTVTFNGPLHNTIKAPDVNDNNTYWEPAFEKDHFEKLLLSTTGITERVRLDLKDQDDGQPGINIAGTSMRNYYNEVSSGKVAFDTGPAGVLAWVQVPHSEGYYAASACSDGVAGDDASMEGLPQNPSFQKYGTGRVEIVKDIIKAVNAANPNFPWKDYDTDGDGAIDHVIFFHAGKDKADGGGEQGIQAFWAHRSSLPFDPDFVASDSGTPNNPNDDIRFNGYTMQYEDATLGVLVHEFGHDLGLPDLYDVTDVGESDPVWWDLMHVGSRTGKLNGSTPSNLSAWCKFALGWTDPQVIAPAAAAQEIKLGQTSRPPSGSIQSVRVNLPATDVTLAELPEGSTQAFWSNNDQDGALVSLTHDINLVGQTAPVSLSFDIDWAIEQDWDYMWVEVSVDGGATYTQTKGFEVGTDDELTTPDDYKDPNGRLKESGKVRAYTGVSGEFLRAYHDLSPFVGQNIKVRFTYRTDEGFLERGTFIDNILVSSAAGTIFNDPVEGNNLNGWVSTVGESYPGAGYTPSTGWILSDGTQSFPKYYLLEWRNYDGFDKGLRYTYNQIAGGVTAEGRNFRRVNFVPSNIPGMLVWVRDTRYGQEPFGAANNILDTARFSEGPSDGPKGGLLIVDAHPDPLRGPRGGILDTGFGVFPFPPADNWNARVQASNAAFGLQATSPLSLTVTSGTGTTRVYTTTAYAGLPAVSGFHDALGYQAGVETLPQPIKTFEGESAPGGPFLLRIKKYAFSDPDASVVVPAKDYYPPRTPSDFTGRGEETSPPSANVSNAETLVATNEPNFNDVPSTASFFSVNVGAPGGVNITGQHSGNPGSDNLQYGNHFEVVGQARDGSYGTIRIYSRQYAAEVHGSFVASPVDTKQITVTATLQNVGSPMAPALYSDFDETQATYVDGSATNGAVPVQATLAQVQAALTSGGVAAVRKLAVPAAGPVTAVVLFPANNLDTGASLSFSYRLTRTGPNVKIVNRAIGPGFAEQSVTQTGQTLYLPVMGRTQATK